MTILCYHTVEPACPSRVAVSPSSFQDQMAYLARRRHVVHPDSVPELVDHRGRLPRTTAAVTFDDGFSGVAEHAAPVLRRLGIPAIVFVVAQTLTDDGRPVDWVDDAPARPSLRTLTKDQVCELVASGMRIGSHSWGHHHLPDMTESEVERDLRASRELLEEVIGDRVVQLAYPRGQHTAHVRRAAVSAGFNAAYSLPERREAASRLTIPRVGVYPANRMRDFRIKLLHPYLDVRLAPGTGAIRFAVRQMRRSGSTDPAQA